jgi:hypothetical protein
MLYARPGPLDQSKEQEIAEGQHSNAEDQLQADAKVLHSSSPALRGCLAPLVAITSAS